MIGITNGIGPMSRRAFLHGGGATFAVLVVAPTAWARSRAKTSNALVRSRFTPHVGAKFRMSGDGPAVDVVLTEINNLSPVLRSQDPNRFALLLEAPADQPAIEGIRTLHSAALGNVNVFVSSVDRGVDARHYEAVINR